MTEFRLFFYYNIINYYINSGIWKILNLKKTK